MTLSWRRLFRWTLALAVVAAAALAVTVYRAPMRSAEVAGRLAMRAAGFSLRTIDGPRGPMSYFEAGSGPLLVLVHGANDQAGGWVRIAPDLAARYHVVAPDLAGHGDSAPQTGPLVLGDLVAGLARVIDAERAGDERVVLVGNSLGGFLALVHAERHPDQVSRVVPINGAIMRGGNRSAAAMLLPRTRNDARRVMEALISPKTPRLPDFVLDDLVSRATRSPLSRLVAAPEASLEQWLLDDRLAGIRTPVALIWGADDQLIPVSYAEQARDRLPAATLDVIPDCGHVPQRECPAQLLPVLRQRLELGSGL
jgi:pimeloyl-ACP methyl ester carboxylesterase